MSETPTLAERGPARVLRGMTLVELLVAMIIVGTLATIAFQAYARVMQRNRVTQAIVDITQLQVDLERYVTQYGAFPTSLAAAGLSRDDPWGHPYAYLNMDGAKVGKVRKDKSLHPLNTDYDLYSMGPDGKTASPLTAKASRDDIVRANNGAFIGTAADY